jgi:hypothetical protein
MMTVKNDSLFSHVLAALAGAFITIVAFTVSYILLRDDNGTQVPANQYQACAWSMAEARAEDDVCVTWLDGDQKVVVGPLWNKP